MSDHEQPDIPDQYRLTGEDAPTWLTIGFTLIGVLLAVATAWLWMTEQTRLQGQRARGEMTYKQATVTTTPMAVSPLLEPVPLPAETPKLAIVGKEQSDVPLDPPPTPSVPATTPASPSTTRENSAAERTIPASTPLPPKLKDCPPAINIAFKQGSVHPIITADIQLHLQQLREWLNGHPEAKLSVEGHTDSIGSERRNLLLSYRRAKMVVALLDQAGVPKQQMTILAAGESDPIEGIPTDSVDNRRVFLRTKGIKNCQEVPDDSEQ